MNYREHPAFADLKDPYDLMGTSTDIDPRDPGLDDGGEPIFPGKVDFTQLSKPTLQRLQDIADMLHKVNALRQESSKKHGVARQKAEHEIEDLAWKAHLAIGALLVTNVYDADDAIRPVVVAWRVFLRDQSQGSCPDLLKPTVAPERVQRMGARATGMSCDSAPITRKPWEGLGRDAAAGDY